MTTNKPHVLRPPQTGGAAKKPAKKAQPVPQSTEPQFVSKEPAAKAKQESPAQQ